MKSKYLSSAFLLLLTSVIVKIIGAVYKIPLTAYIGAVGRGYYASAYNLYLPFHALIMGAFPIALSKITGKYNAQNNDEAVSLIKTAAHKLFFKVGLIGMAVILLISKPYCNLIASSPKSFLSVVVLAPSILFSALASSYRGYYEGFMNMKPTSVSQLIEALFKMVFGLVFARLSMSYLYTSYLKYGIVLGNKVSSEEEAFSLIYPVTSAAAILGVTFGCFLSLIYVFIYHQINKPSIPVKNRTKTKHYENELLSFSFPIMISCAVQSVFQFLDTASVQWALSLINSNELRSIYSNSLAVANTSVDDIGAYVYGILSSATDFKNLVPGITMALGVCAVPAVSAAYETNDKEHLSSLINSVFKYTFIISSAGGMLIALCSTDILNLFYSSSAPDIVISCDELIKYFALTVPFYSLAGTAVFCVQATGNAKKSIAPYVISGIIRVILNILLVSNEKMILNGCIISGAVGYWVMFFWNRKIVKKACDIKISEIKIIIKPLLVSVLTYFSSDFIIKHINFFKNQPINLLMKSVVFCLIFCMLCFLFKVPSLGELFWLFKSKKNGLNT
ncbi:MAG: polysaccharide biosynthesis C-terminal domain-containing protein [Eubacterium sp.]|nr:polysaccharide biosynthesis C-terminal domain-containing protein [Eubacterium sp.]